MASGRIQLLSEKFEKSEKASSPKLISLEGASDSINHLRKRKLVTLTRNWHDDGQVKMTSNSTYSGSDDHHLLATDHSSLHPSPSTAIFSPVSTAPTSLPHQDVCSPTSNPDQLDPRPSVMSSQSSLFGMSPYPTSDILNYSTGDHRIEDLLETLGYSSNPSSDPKPQLDRSHGRDPVVMLDIQGDEFTIHEHSLSPVSERTELSTISSKRSKTHQSVNPLGLTSHRLIPQNAIQSTPPLCLSPKHKPKHSMLSLPNQHLHPHSHSTHPALNHQSIGPNSIDRLKIFGDSKSNQSKDSDHRRAQKTSSLVPDNNQASLNRPSLQRIPKKATALIQMFEGGASSSSSASAASTNPPISLAPHKHRPLPTSAPAKSSGSSALAHLAPINRLQYSIPTSLGPSPSQRLALDALEASKRSRAARQQKHFSSEASLSDPQQTSNRPFHRADRLLADPSSPVNSAIESAVESSQAEKERIRLRNERRHRTALAEKGQLMPPACTSLPIKKSPMSDHLIQHRKSIASSITSNLSDVQILQHGLIWYRNPSTNEWHETKGLLTSDAIYLMNDDGNIDPQTKGSPIELSLKNCTAVESVRSKRSYGPEFSDPHLHIMKIAWTEFDTVNNQRVEHEEFLGCTRATQRADWVGAIWQAAHDLGGFIEQPDIPLAGKTSSVPSSPRPDPPPIEAISQAQMPSPSPRLDAVTLVDRAMSVTESHHHPSYLAPSYPSHHAHLSSLQSSETLPGSSGDSAVSVATTTLQSELARELNESLIESSDLRNNPRPSTDHLYSEAASQMLKDALGEITNSEVGVGGRGDVIDPNLDRQPSRKKSPELDIFAMLERMSVRGSIHNRTSQFYDAPGPSSAAVLPHQQSQNMHNPQPISPAEHPDISALENDASESHHSFHTIRPTSAAGVHERFLDSPRSSLISASNARSVAASNAPSSSLGNLSHQSTPRRHRYNLQDSGMTSTPQGPRNHAPSYANSSASPSPKEKPTPPGTDAPKGRGAWSDLERGSAHTDGEIAGALPRRAVQRDLQRILKTIERKDSYLMVQSDSLGAHLDNIQTQLQNVAAKLKGHEASITGAVNGQGEESAEPTIADKVDYMLSLCNILLESQHKVSAAVEKNLKAHGVNVDSKSMHTRSMRSTTNTTSRSSSARGRGQPGPSSPLPEASLDEDQRSSFTRIPPASPPLPPLPVEDIAENGDLRPPDPEPELVAAEPVAVQEAGLSRIENLLVALLGRMDEAAVVRQQAEAPPNQPPPLPEKDEESLLGDDRDDKDGNEKFTSEAASTLDLDADVALWKSSGKLSTGGPRKWTGSSSAKSNSGVGCSARNDTSRANKLDGERAFGSIETDSSDQQNYQTIPDYNLAYEAEDAVARRIADERARAARRLEGILTPYGMSRNSAYDDTVEQQHHEPLPVVTTATCAPGHDLMRGERNERSHWSITTPSPQLEMPAAPSPPTPPSPPPKDPPEQIISPPPRPPMLTLSERVQSLRSSRASTRPASVVSFAHSSRLQNALPPEPVQQSEKTTMVMHPPPPPIPAISTDEIKMVFKETLEDHSSHQAPMFDEMVTLLRSQDQVSQATVMNQAEVSRYLTQLNSHLEGVLQKKSEDVEMITQSVRQLQDQLAVLVEQSSRIATAAPAVVVEQPLPDIDRGMTDDSGGTEENAGEGEMQVEPEQQGIQFEVEEGAEVAVGVGVSDETGRHVSSMTKRPSASHRIGGPRARKISLAGKSLRGPRMPSTLTNIGKLWGGPTPVADRAARWGGAGGGGTLRRAPTGKSAMTAIGEPANVEGALAGLCGDETGRPGGVFEAVAGGGGEVDERTGTIAMGVSHILKLLRDNQTKEEERRKQKEIEKASQPKPTIPNEMEERRAKIEELQLRREAALADDKAKNMEAIMISMRQQATEHEKLLKQIVEEMGKRKESMVGDEEEEQRRRHEESMEGVNRVLTTVESGVMTHLEEFKAQMFAEMKQTFEKVGELRDQKQQIQSDIADMLCFMSKVRGGGPDPRWQYPISSSSLPPGSVNGSAAGAGGGIGETGYVPIPTVYPTPQMDFNTEQRREHHHHVGGGTGDMETKNNGFGPRPPGRR